MEGVKEGTIRHNQNDENGNGRSIMPVCSGNARKIPGEQYPPNTVHTHLLWDYALFKSRRSAQHWDTSFCHFRNVLESEIKWL